MPAAALPLLAPTLALAALLGCRPAAPLPPPDLRALEPRERMQVQEPHRGDGEATRAVAGEEAPAAICPGNTPCRVDAGVAHRIALARGHGVLAVAAAASGNTWVEGDGQGGPSSPRVSLLLHDRALTPIGEAVYTFAHAIGDVAVAPTTDGWLLAAGGAKGIELVHLTPDGREQGPRLRVDGSTPRLVADADAPLLVRLHRRGLLAAPVDRGGLRWEAVVFEQTTEPEFGGQIALGGGEFLIARRAAGVTVARVGAGGRRGAIHAEVGDSTEYPTLAGCADGPRLVWTDFGRSPAEVRWARLDGEGAVIGAPVRVSGTPEHFNHAPSVCDGADTIVLLTGYTGGTGLSNALDLARVDPEGRRRGDLLRVSQGSIIDPEVVADDDAVVVAWVALGERPRFAVARVPLAAIGGARPAGGAQLAR